MQHWWVKYGEVAKYYLLYQGSKSNFAVEEWYIISAV